MSRLLPLGALLALTVYYVYFAGVGLRAGLTHDDLMNAHRAVLAPWPSLIKDCLFFFLPSDQYRPVGSVFYRICHDLFGFAPGPLHAGIFVLWAVSLAFVYDTVRRLASSREVALLTVLLMAHHSNRPFYYYNSGFCYDVLCQLFYFATFSYYLRARESGARLAEKQLLVLSALYTLALGSKEMAVSLPVVLATYEWLRSPRDWRFPMVSAVMAAAFTFGRVMSRDGLSGIDGYRITLRPVLYLESWTGWLSSLFYITNVSWAVAAAFLGACLLLAWLSFDRTLRVAVVLALVGVWPLAFVRPARGLEALAIPVTGVAMMLAWWLARLSLVATWRWRAPALFVLVLVLLADLHARKQPPVEAMMSEGVEIGQVQAQLEVHGPFPPRSRILFLVDPFPEPFVFATTFLLQIQHGASLQITRADRLAATSKPDWSQYDYVFSWQERRIVSLKGQQTASSTNHRH